MGIYDRDYYRDDARRAGFGWATSGWSVTAWLIAVNVAVFFLDAILGRISLAAVAEGPIVANVHPLEILGSFSIEDAVYRCQIWRFFTFQFLHVGIWHLAFNMLALFWFGGYIEDYLGSRRYLAFYLLCGVAGAACFTLLWALQILPYHIETRLIGASAGVFGVLVGAAVIAPNLTVLVMFVLPMTLRTLAIVMLAITVYNVIDIGGNAGGDAGHLGGAILGYFLIRHPQWLNWATLQWARPRATILRARPDAWRKAFEPSEEDLNAEIDRILAKIHDHGLDSLTEREKATLKRKARRS